MIGSHHHHHHHVGIAFGSCNRPLLSQSYWKDIDSYHPSYYLWTGDAVYAKNHTIEALEHAYNMQVTNEFYRNFIHSNHVDDHDNSSCSSSTSLPVIIDGIWDDHDYGVNDGGRYVHQQDQRQQLYHDFIASSNSGCNKDQHQSHQHGSNSNDVQNDYASPLLASSSSPSNLYHSRDIHLDGLKIKILFLDTRSHRDDHYIKSLGMS